jgi:hypothetical protein
MFDIVAPYENEAALAVYGGGFNRANALLARILEHVCARQSDAAIEQHAPCPRPEDDEGDDKDKGGQIK